MLKLKLPVKCCSLACSPVLNVILVSYCKPPGACVGRAAYTSHSQINRVSNGPECARSMWNSTSAFGEKVRVLRARRSGYPWCYNSQGSQSHVPPNQPASDSKHPGTNRDPDSHAQQAPKSTVSARPPT